MTDVLRGDSKLLKDIMVLFFTKTDLGVLLLSRGYNFLLNGCDFQSDRAVLAALLCGASLILVLPSERCFIFHSRRLGLVCAALSCDLLGTVLPSFPSTDNKGLDVFPYFGFPLSPTDCSC